MNWMLMPLRRYADFQGRSQRMEYWMFSLFIFLAMMVWALLFALVGGFAMGPEMNGAAMAVLGLGVIGIFGIIVPSIAVTVRRFHDLDKSGWLYLLSFIPYVGGIIVFVFMVLPGTAGENRFGPDPKDPTAGAAGLERVFS